MRMFVYASSIALTVFCAGACVDDVPPVFADKTLAQAREAVKGSEKFLVVKATASWCGPCKLMDKTTWRDPRVEAWFKANGLAIELDVDKSVADARPLHIMAMPTMIAFKGDTEFDRIVGYEDADKFMQWLDGLKAGKRHADEINRSIKDVQDGTSKLTMTERMSLAREMVAAQRFNEAVTEYAWLWLNMVKREPAMVGVRRSFLVNDIQGLIAAHQPAATKFAELRAAAEESLAKSPLDFELRTDWICINSMLDETDRTIAWFDKAIDDPAQRPSIDNNAYALKLLLVEKERWDAMSKLVKDPAKELETILEISKITARPPAGADEATVKFLAEHNAQSLRSQCSQLYAAMLAGKRLDDARMVYDKSVKADPSPEMKAALDAFAAKFK